MKGDFSRPSGEAIRPYAATLHQQGRVWLDSDWNDEVFEQLARTEAGTRDVIGAAGTCAVPAGGFAFAISAIPGVANDFVIDGGPGPEGRAYVDGLLAQIPNAAYYSAQAAYPNAPALPVPAATFDSPPSSPPVESPPAGAAIVYLEVWQRLITAEQDPAIRETALGGPDTTVRLATVAQVKVAPLPATISSLTCGAAALYIPGDGSGTLTTLPTVEALPPDPCRISDPQTYTGRENALYRVEIHDPGDVLGSALPFALGADAAPAATQVQLAAPLSSTQVSAIVNSGSVTIRDGSGASESVSITSVAADLVTLTLAQGLANAYHIANGAAIYATGGSFAIGLGADAAAGATQVTLAAALTAAQVSALEATGYILIEDDSATERVGVSGVGAATSTLNLVRGLSNSYAAANNAQVKGGVAFFKWSSRNGSDAITITSLSSDGLTLTLDSLGRDATTALHAGDLVEVIDDVSELGSGRGLLTYVTADPDPNVLTVTLADPVPSSFGIGASRSPGGGSHPILRRWDGTGIASAAFDPGGTTPELDLGDGIHIQFGGGDLRAGDYWQFKARALDGSVDVLTSAAPNGIRRHRAPLAVIEWVPMLSAAGTPELAIQVASDCRQPFPALTNALGADAGIHVTGLSTVDSIGNSYPLDNDVVIFTDARFAGIAVACDRPIDQNSVSRSTCFVTVELPFALPQPSDAVPAGSAEAYQSVTLAAQVGLANANTIIWSPRLDQSGLTQLAALAPANDKSQLLTRLTLVGDFIRSADQTMVLDGNAFGTAAAGHTGLALPSGDQRRGGDFSMWFWLQAPAAAAFNLYITNTPASTVTVFPATATGAAQPARTLDAQSSLVYPGGIALDVVGNLYVSNQRPTYTYVTTPPPPVPPVPGPPPRLPTPIPIRNPVIESPIRTPVFQSPARPIGTPPRPLVLVITVLPPAVAPAFARTFEPDRAAIEQASSASWTVRPLLSPTGTVAEAGNGLSPLLATSAATAATTSAAATVTAIPHYYVSVFKAGFVQGDPPLYQLGGPATGITAPVGIAVDSAGTLYVANAAASGTNGAVLIFAAGSQGNVAPTGTLGTTNLVSNPAGIAVDSSGKLYVVDSAQILVFTAPIGQSAPAVISAAPTLASAIAAPVFIKPYGIAVDKNGLIYVTNQTGGSTDSVVIFNPAQLAWANGGTLAPGASAMVPNALSQDFATTIGIIGPPTVTFTTVGGIAVDSSLDIYVVDTGANAVRTFAPYVKGQDGTQFKPTATISGTALSSPAFIAVG